MTRSRHVWNEFGLFGLVLVCCLAIQPARALADADLAAMPAALLMVDDAACVYCRKWDREVSSAYENSEEGQLAPLVRRPIRSNDVRKFVGIRGTPTFLLLVDGREVGRIIGYAGPDFFWGELQQLVDKAGLKSSRKKPAEDIRTDSVRERKLRWNVSLRD